MIQCYFIFLTSNEYYNTYFVATEDVLVKTKVLVNLEWGATTVSFDSPSNRKDNESFREEPLSLCLTKRLSLEIFLLSFLSISINKESKSIYICVWLKFDNETQKPKQEILITT